MPSDSVCFSGYFQNKKARKSLFFIACRTRLSRLPSSSAWWRRTPSMWCSRICGRLDVTVSGTPLLIRYVAYLYLRSWTRMCGTPVSFSAFFLGNESEKVKKGSKNYFETKQKGSSELLLEHSLRLHNWTVRCRNRRSRLLRQSETYSKKVANGTVLALQRNPDFIVFFKACISDFRTGKTIANEIKLLESKEAAVKLSRK